MSLPTMGRIGTAAVLLAVLSLGGAAAQEVAVQHFPADEDLHLMLRYLVEDGEAPGVALGVVEADGSSRVVAYGEGPEGQSLSPRSVLGLGSLTMTFTATLLAVMVRRGDVVLEDPVTRYLPRGTAVPAPGGYTMTLGDLATHRSGLPAGPGAGRDDVTVEDLYELLSEVELDSPGRRYEFSRLGYALLGHALAGAAGVTYDELLRDRVLEPLGMSDTGYPPDAGVARGLRGATGLRSSATDMLRFVRANVHPSGSPLGPAMVSAREIRDDRGLPDGLGYGFSWRTQSIAEQPPIVTHGGATDRTTSMIAFDPEKGIGTVVLVSRSGFNDWIGRTLLFFDPPAWDTVHVDPPMLRPYEGVYEVGQDRYTAAHDRGRYFIRLEDEGYLTYQARGAVRTRLYATSDSTFYMLRGPYTLTFSPRADAVRLVIHVDQREPESPVRSWRAWKASEDVPPPAVIAGNERSWSTWGTGRWTLLGLVVALVLAAILRPFWSRGGAGRGVRSGPTRAGAE